MLVFFFIDWFYLIFRWILRLVHKYKILYLFHCIKDTIIYILLGERNRDLFMIIEKRDRASEMIRKRNCREKLKIKNK